MDHISVGVVKTIGSWLLLPVTLLLGVFGFQYKKILGRVEALEGASMKSQLLSAKFSVEIAHLEHQLEKLDAKLDKILEHVKR